MEEERVCERGYAHIVGARKVGVERESGRGRGKQKSRGRDRQEDRDRQRQRDREKQQAQGSHSLPSKAYLQAQAFPSQANSLKESTTSQSCCMLRIKT